MQGKFKIGKKPVVQLTSLLDLLFVMIFISLMQQKQVSKQPEVKVVTETIIKEKVVEKVVEKPVKKPVEPEKPKPTEFSITAIFNFYGTPSNPGIPQGSYRMSGSYDRTSGKLFLGGVEWINQPNSYEMVPLGGKIEGSEDLFTGRIQFQGCKQFTLRRVSNSDKTPISGSWEGTYDCTQGATGLTLTIQ